MKLELTRDIKSQDEPNAAREEMLQKMRSMIAEEEQRGYVLVQGSLTLELISNPGPRFRLWCEMVKKEELPELPAPWTDEATD